MVENWFHESGLTEAAVLDLRRALVQRLMAGEVVILQDGTVSILGVPIGSLLMPGDITFANAAARDAYYVAPMVGDRAFLQDVGYIQEFDGTAWVTKTTVVRGPIGADGPMGPPGPPGEDGSGGGGTAETTLVDQTNFSGPLSTGTVPDVQVALEILDGVFVIPKTLIEQGDSKVEIVDNGVDPAVISVIGDGQLLASFSSTGNRFGPVMISGNLSSNNSYSAIESIAELNGGEVIPLWSLVYFDPTAGEFLLGDANAAGKAPAWGVATLASADGQPITVMTRGIARYDTWNWTPGAVLYLSTTPGGLTATAPATAGDIVQPVGRAITATQVYFNVDPINGWYEKGA